MNVHMSDVHISSMCVGVCMRIHTHARGRATPAHSLSLFAVPLSLCKNYDAISLPATGLISKHCSDSLRDFEFEQGQRLRDRTMHGSLSWPLSLSRVRFQSLNLCLLQDPLRFARAAANRAAPYTIVLLACCLLLPTGRNVLCKCIHIGKKMHWPNSSA